MHEAAAGAAPSSVLCLEVNEADGHFLRKFTAAGALPAFSRVLEEGVCVRTRIPGWRDGGARAWRSISPWIVWPSLYTGLGPGEHGIVGFGQDPGSLVGRCVWDVLDAEGVSTGVFGSLMSHPPRSAGHAAFYVPEALADDAECFPDSARPLQEFNLFAARHYSEGFGPRAVEATGRLLRAMRSGVSAASVLRTLWQVPAEWLRGPAREPERAMLQASMGWEAFRKLRARHAPAFATFHTNHVAYMQHRYWRAAEPERFSRELSETDARFFASPDERDRYERGLAHWIETSFRFADRMLAESLERAAPGDVVLVVTGLGQRPMDPVTEIHNPVLRVAHERELLDAAGLSDYEVLHQMNPDLTVNLRDAEAARRAEARLAGLHVAPGRPLFHVQRRGRQLFLELELPRGLEGGGAPVVRHAERPELAADLWRHVVLHGSNDQSTAHHTDEGLLLAWRKGGPVTCDAETLDVLDVAPSILGLWGIDRPSWMQGRAALSCPGRTSAAAA